MTNIAQRDTTQTQIQYMYTHSLSAHLFSLLCVFKSVHICISVYIQYNLTYPSSLSKQHCNDLVLDLCGKPRLSALVKRKTERAFELRVWPSFAVFASVIHLTIRSLENKWLLSYVTDSLWRLYSPFDLPVQSYHVPAGVCFCVSIYK